MHADRTNRILRTYGHTHLASFCLFANFLQLDLLLFPRFLHEMNGQVSGRTDRLANEQQHTEIQTDRNEIVQRVQEGCISDRHSENKYEYLNISKEQASI